MIYFDTEATYFLYVKWRITHQFIRIQWMSNHGWELRLEPCCLDPEFCGLFITWSFLWFVSRMCELGFLEG